MRLLRSALISDINPKLELKMMTTILRLLLVASVISRLDAAAGVEVDKDLEDILGEEVGEMSYSDVKDLIGSRGNNSSSHREGNFDVVNERTIDNELSDSDSSSSLASWQIFLIVLGSLGPFSLVLVGLCYCTVLCCEKVQGERERKRVIIKV